MTGNLQAIAEQLVVLEDAARVEHRSLYADSKYHHEELQDEVGTEESWYGGQAQPAQEQVDGRDVLRHALRWTRRERREGCGVGRIDIRDIFVHLDHVKVDDERLAFRLKVNHVEDSAGGDEWRGN